ncbi:Cell wall glucanase, partial [Rasamsonia emersonii CBS 393.64]
MTLLFLLGLLAAAITSVHAQTWTDCNPTKQSCAPDPAFGTSWTWNWSSNSILDSTWNITNGAVDYTDNAMMFSIQKRLDSPTIRSNFYIFFGRIEYHVQAAPGHGVISSVVLQSDDLDEVDWEWVGSESPQVQTNYFSKGQTVNGSAATFNISGSTTDDYHNYTTYWTKDKLEWWVDGHLLRTLNYEDAEGGTAYPQTPMTIRLGIWPGGDPSQPQGRIEWAGGVINYDDGPYNMYVQQVSVQDFSTGKEYVYSNRDGTYQSITIVPGNSTAAETLYKHHESVAQKWANLPQGAKVGVYAAAAGAAGLGLAVLIF